MLEKIVVYGLFDEIDYEIVLKKGPLTFIHAQNGYGKSTVMRMVCNVLQGNMDDVRTVAFSRMDLVFDNGTKLIVENHNQDITIQISKNEMEEEISADELADVLPALYIDPERAYVYDDDGSIVPSLMVYMKELADSIGDAIKDSELRPAKDDGRPISDADMDQLFRNTEARVNFIRQAGFGPTIPAGMRFPPSRFEISENRDGYRRLALSLETYVDRYYCFAESIVIFKDIVNTLFVNKTVEVNDKGFMQARMDRSGTIIPINKFSSGEKQILIMFYLLLFRAQNGSLVVVDEPEVSLHVSWQQQIGKFMQDVAKVRGLQLIISTHAPAVIHDDWDLAVELEKARTN